jgi:hypothetical protein
MHSKDTYEFQKARIIQVVEELAPGKAVEFDNDSTFIRFRVRDPFLNIPSELADKPDDWMRAFIKNLAAGKI